MLGLTRGLARELGEQGIRINVVSPGWVMTERQLHAVGHARHGRRDRAPCSACRTPLQPPDIAGMVLFLAADDGRGCTAQEFIVDAGWT